jgi:peptidoglycan/xylan/chitin deacetylase (PgdA/CDA1 family)
MKPLSRLETMLMRAGGALLAPGGGGGSLLVLKYHRVLAAPDLLLPEVPDTHTFAAHMDLVGATCRVLPLSEAVERLFSTSLPPRAACITFDDGYANNLTNAAPILAARQLPATVFVSTGFIGAGRMWNDTVIEAVRRAGAELDLSDLGLPRYLFAEVGARRRAIDAILTALQYRPFDARIAAASVIAERVGHELPSDLMMSAAQVQGLRAYGIETGAHTVSHPILRRVSPETARLEIETSKATLEALTGTTVSLFAYPNGEPARDYDRSHVEMVRRAGFSAAVSTAWGVATRDSDRYQIPRLLPWDRSALRFSLRLLRARLESRSATA